MGNDDEELASTLMRLLEQPELVKEITGQGNDWVKQRLCVGCDFTTYGWLVGYAVRYAPTSEWERGRVHLNP